jgi:Uma2 family endonuclease
MSTVPSIPSTPSPPLPVAPEQAARLITGEELLAMGDIGPCELIDGRIVPMTPPGGEHGRIEMSLGAMLFHFVQQHDLGWVIGGEAGVYIQRNPDTVRGMDIAFFSKQRLPEGPPQGYFGVAPELVVEVLSPRDSWTEVQQKVAEYFSIGVQRVWVVNPRKRTVLVYRSATEAQELAEGDPLVGEGVLEGFALPVETLFRR